MRTANETVWERGRIRLPPAPVHGLNKKQFRAASQPHRDRALPPYCIV